MGIVLFAPALDVALHELLGILLEDVVDLVEDLVELLLDLLALLRQLGARRRLVAVGLPFRPLYLLLLLLGHDASLTSGAAPLSPLDCAGATSPAPASHARELDTLLRLVLPLAVRVGDGARLVGLEEEH